MLQDFYCEHENEEVCKKHPCCFQSPSEFCKQIRATIEEVVTEKLSLQLQPPTNSHLPEKALLKATDVCEIFQVSKPTLYEWLKQKKLKSFKIMSRRYFLRAEIEALISGQEKRR